MLSKIQTLILPFVFITLSNAHDARMPMPAYLSVNAVTDKFFPNIRAFNYCSRGFSHVFSLSANNCVMPKIKSHLPCSKAAHYQLS
jgi:hypothetical protein